LSEALLELRFAARPAQLKTVREHVRIAALSAGCGDTCTGDIVLAVDEACQNVIRHGYAGDPAGQIELVIEREDDDLVISIGDTAPPVDPARVKPRDLDDLRPGGLGTHLIKSVMDRAEFQQPEAEHGNLLRMWKRIE